jgi:hypothetical protein
MQSLSYILQTSFLCRTLLLLMLSFSINAASIESEIMDVPIIEGARVFAKFDDKTPVVINYFTSVTEDGVIAFYNKNYGEPIQHERKRDRLTLYYQKELQQVRVVISQQNKLRQVDIIVDKRTVEP